MARQRFEVEPGQFVIVNLDDLFPIGMRIWTIIQAHLVDNVTNRPVLSKVTILFDPTSTRMQAIIAADGWLALAGRPVDLFPNLAVQGYVVRFTIYAGGYQPLAQAPPIPVTPGFPNIFQPQNLGDIQLIPN